MPDQRGQTVLRQERNSYIELKGLIALVKPLQRVLLLAKVFREFVS